MTVFTLDDLITVHSQEEVLAELLSLCASLGEPTTAWQPGNPILTMLQADAETIANASLISVDIAKGGFGDLLPNDAWADLWARSRFNVTRVPAEPATGQLTIANVSLTSYVKQPGEVTVAHATTGKTYRNVDPIAIDPGVTVGVNFQAVESGVATSAAPGTITVLVTTLTGVTVTNPGSFIGNDQETTPALVARARLRLDALSPNGPKGVYLYVASTPEFSPTSSPITRVKVVLDEGTGNLSVYLATADGAPTGGDVAIVQSAFDTHAEPWGTTATALASTEVPVPITYQAWIQGTQLTTAQIQSAIGTALAAFFATLPIGGYVIPPSSGKVYVRALERVIGGAVPGIIQVAVTLPATDLALTALQVATLGAITSTITVLE